MIAILLCDRIVTSKTEGLHYESLPDLPPHRVALVLGCSERLTNGRANLYFRNRIDAAVAVLEAGKCQYLLVSGDNGHAEYNEPEAMKAALMNRGVPEARIVSDYAGFRTLDSVVRAKEVFQEERILVISQRFHNQRAIYIGKHRGITVTGYNAAAVRHLGEWKTKMREKLARAKMMLDLQVLRKPPRYLGDPIEIGTPVARG